MEAMVELPTVGKDQIAHWLTETAGCQEAAVRTATAHLEAAQTVPKFALCLLMLSAGKQFRSLHLMKELASLCMAMIRTPGMSRRCAQRIADECRCNFV